MNKAVCFILCPQNASSRWEFMSSPATDFCFWAVKTRGLHFIFLTTSLQDTVRWLEPECFAEVQDIAHLLLRSSETYNGQGSQNQEPWTRFSLPRLMQRSSYLICPLLPPGVHINRKLKLRRVRIPAQGTLLLHTDLSTDSLMANACPAGTSLTLGFGSVHFRVKTKMEFHSHIIRFCIISHLAASNYPLTRITYSITTQ